MVMRLRNEQTDERASDAAGDAADAPEWVDGEPSAPAGARAAVPVCYGGEEIQGLARRLQEALTAAGFATAGVNLLTADEDLPEADLPKDVRLQVTAEGVRLDARRQADRLAEALAWLRRQPELDRLPMALLGLGSGGGAALSLAAARPELCCALTVVSGRPDIAGTALAVVRTPTLFIVGAKDHLIIDFNHHAAQRLAGEHRLTVVPGSGRQFNEPGALDIVARLTTEWFLAHLERPSD